MNQLALTDGTFDENSLRKQLEETSPTLVTVAFSDSVELTDQYIQAIISYAQSDSRSLPRKTVSDIIKDLYIILQSPVAKENIVNQIRDKAMKVCGTKEKTLVFVEKIAGNIFDITIRTKISELQTCESNKSNSVT